METRLLRYFLAVIDHGGVSAAADALNMAQPSLSQALKTLERETGVLLFHRVGRRMVLTAAGEDLESRARRIISELELAQTAMDGFAGLDRGTLVISVTANDSFYPLARAMGRFLQSHPKIEVKLMPTLFFNESVDQVLSGQAELGFVPRSRELTYPDSLVTYRISESAMYIAVSPQLRQLGDRCSIADIADIPMITRPKGTHARRLVDEAIENGVRVRVLVDSAHDSMLPRLIADGMGCAVMPKSLAMDAELLGASIALLDPPEIFDLLLIHRRSRLSPAAKRFLDDGVWRS